MASESHESPDGASAASSNASGLDRGRFVRYVKEGNIDAVRALLAEGEDPNSTDEYHTALCAAIQRDQVAVFQLLMDRSADPNRSCPSLLFQIAPLHFAAGNPNPMFTRVLLDARADVDARCWRGSTPLHYCRTIESLELLLAAGADVYSRSHSGRDSGRSVFEELAVYRNRPEIAKRLLQQEGSRVHRDEAGLRALYRGKKDKIDGDVFEVVLLPLVRQHMVQPSITKWLKSDFPGFNRATECAEVISLIKKFLQQYGDISKFDFADL